MLTKDNIKSLVRVFLHEACGYLEIDDSQINIDYIPMPFPRMMQLKELDDIVVDTNMLAKVAENNCYTILRSDVYRIARKIYQRRKHCAEGTCEDYETDMIDADAFMYALCFLNGLSMIIPRQQLDKLYSKILQILNEEFQENCVLHAMPDSQFKGMFRYRAKKTSKAHKAELRFFKELKPSLITTNVINGKKGSESNPFDNVLEACRFIKDEERKAFEQDLYMSKMLSNRRFNYCADVNIYNIKWADGKASYCHPEVPDSAFIVNQLMSGRFSIKPNLYGRKFLYRGQSKYYEVCTPGLFRNPKQTYFLKELIQYDELRAVLASHPLVQLFERGIDLWHDMFRFEINYGGLAQHYYNKTNFLDLTSDIDAAKFFAITDYRFDEYTPHTDTQELGVIYYYELAEPGAFMPQKKQHLSTIGKQLFMRSGCQHGFLLNMEKGVNFNELPQVHKVFFRHNPSISQQIYKESNNGKIYFPLDILQIQWKRFLKQFDENPVVSFDAVEINAKDNFTHHETVKSISRKLEKMYGIKTDKDKIPVFDSDLMNQYYEDIKNGWWQDEFCKDIYFASSDGIVYKDMLLNVPKDSRYSKYFVQ